MKSLIVGTGFGSLYKTEILKLDPNAQIVTVDANPNMKADYPSINDVPKDIFFDTVNICTPNYLHEDHTRAIAARAKLVMVEKPGVANSERWRQLCADFPNTRITMVKNNMFRPQIKSLIECAKKAESVDIVWDNIDRVPSPGSWFTDKDKAFGGVSRDLMPHLLSLVPALYQNSWQNFKLTYYTTSRRYDLKDLESTSYGSVNANGVYNVDDQAKICLEHGGLRINLRADWRTLREKERSVTFKYNDDTSISFNFGLCPNDVYGTMVNTLLYMAQPQCDTFWEENLKIDCWIHDMIAGIYK